MAGCGDDGGAGQLADAPPNTTDGQADAPIDAAPSPVTITVTQSNQPVMGVTVYFQQPDSMLVRDAKTDAAGKASAIVRSGGFVTVIEPQQVGVCRGSGCANLDLNSFSPEPDSINFDVSVPNEEVGHLYTLYSSCGQAEIGVGNSPLQSTLRTARAGQKRAATRALGIAATPVTNTVNLNNCGGTADLLIVATETESGSITGWIYKPNMAVATGVAITIDGDYTQPADVEAAYTHVPPYNNTLLVERELRSPRGHLLNLSQLSAAVEPDGHTASVTHSVPGPATLIMVTSTTDQPNEGFGQHRFIDWGPAQAYALDFGAAALPHYSSRPSMDGAAHALIWHQAATGAAPDYVLGTYQASRLDETQSVQHLWTWRIAAPYAPPYLDDAVKIVYPTLPTTIYDYNATADDEPFPLRLTGVKSPGGYDAIRAHAFASVSQQSDVPAAVVGAAGRIVVQDPFEPPVESRTAAPAAPRGLIAPRAPGFTRAAR
jgi:hypothetical protein